MTYLLYARDLNTNETIPVDLPVDGTLGDLIRELDNPRTIRLHGEDLRHDKKEETLADLGLCPESVIYYSKFISIAEFRRRYWEFVLENEEKVDWGSISKNPNIT